MKPSVLATIVLSSIAGVALVIVLILMKRDYLGGWLDFLLCVIKVLGVTIVAINVMEITK